MHNEASNNNLGFVWDLWAEIFANLKNVTVYIGVKFRSVAAYENFQGGGAGRPLGFPDRGTSPPHKPPLPPLE